VLGQGNPFNTFATNSVPAHEMIHRKDHAIRQGLQGVRVLAEMVYQPVGDAEGDCNRVGKAIVETLLVTTMIDGRGWQVWILRLAQSIVMANGQARSHHFWLGAGQLATAGQDQERRY